MIWTLLDNRDNQDEDDSFFSIAGLGSQADLQTVIINI